jgi:CHAT domain-containing protein/tetratricopeptide (TPR) repeat protein
VRWDPRAALDEPTDWLLTRLARARYVVAVILPLLAAFTLAAHPLAPQPHSTPTAVDPATVMRDAQRAVESGRDVTFESRWRAALARNPRDPAALLALGTVEYLRNHYARADSLFDRVLAVEPRSSWTAAAHLGEAVWRALGDDVPRADTLLSQAQEEAVAAKAPRIAAQALLGLAQIRSRTKGPRAGLELARRARAVLTDGLAEDSAAFTCFEASRLQQLGDSTALSRMIEGVAIAKRSGSDRVWGNCELLFAQVVEATGHFPEAARSAAHAVQLFARIHYLVGVANASQWLGFARFERGDFNGALTDLERAVQAARATGFRWVEAWAHADLANLYIALGDVGSARQEAALAVPLHTAAGDLWGLANDRRVEAFVLLSQRRYEEAATRFATAVADFRRAGLPFYAVESLRMAAIANMGAGRLDSAAQALDQATRLARASSNRGWLDELPVHLARVAMLRGNFRLADSLIASARPQYAWRADSVSTNTMDFAALEAQLALREGRAAAADSAVAHMTAAITIWRRVLAGNDLRAGLAQLTGSWGSLVDIYPDLVARLAAAGHVGTAFELIESIRGREIAEGTLRSIARMSDTAIASGAIRRFAAGPVVVSEAATRARLRRDEALVLFSLGAADAPTTALVLTRDTLRAISLASREKIVPSIERYLRVAVTGTEPIALSRQLGAALLQPIISALPASITRIAISPDGELYRVPFDALRLSDDRPAVERFAISLVPSATVAYMLERLPATEHATGVVAIGDPSFDDAGLHLARLRFSATEARRVGDYGFRSIVLTRSDATESAIRRLDWSRIGVVHFATHALVAADGPSRTALALTPSGRDDGLLTAPEIASLPIRGALVVLSGCESFGGQVLGGEGLRGLAAPLIEAGARAVVATHWPINDRGVLPFVDRFYAGMAAGKTAGDALRDAKLAALREHGSIADWAAFTIIGDASMRPALKRISR